MFRMVRARFPIILAVGPGLLSCENRAPPRSVTIRRRRCMMISPEPGVRMGAEVRRFRPRPSVSAALEATRRFFESELEALGWETQRQEFEERTPRSKTASSTCGPIPRRRHVGPSAAARRWFALRHEGVQRHRVCRANDGASGNAVMLELARVTSQRPDWRSKSNWLFSTARRPWSIIRLRMDFTAAAITRNSSAPSRPPRARRWQSSSTWSATAN